MFNDPLYAKKRLVCFSVFRLRPHFFLIKCTVKMNMEHWWTKTDEGNRATRTETEVRGQNS